MKRPQHASEHDDCGPALGHVVACPEQYNPKLLVSIPRTRGRALLGLGDELPFSGADRWMLYEVSWLEQSGKPRRLVLEMDVPCTSPNLVESKSLKLYLNSLNFKRFASDEAALRTIREDVSCAVGSQVQISARELSDSRAEPPQLLQTWFNTEARNHMFSEDNPTDEVPPWHLIDGEDIGELPDAAFDAGPDSALLRLNPLPEMPAAVITTGPPPHEERLVTHLLRTLCPVTSQPDWGSLLVEYEADGSINRPGLLRYIVTMRRESGFHENAVEQLFLALMEQCKPAKLHVTGRFMRRGGIDINPTRSFGYAKPMPPPNVRVPGQ